MTSQLIADGMRSLSRSGQTIAKMISDSSTS